MLQSIKSAKCMLMFLSFIYFSHSSKEKDPKIKLIFGGDVVFSGVIEYHVKIGNCTYNESFSKIKPVLKEADHVIVNLESAFANLQSRLKKLNANKSVNLISDLSAASTLKYAGIDIVAMANNHMIDFGDGPLNKTIQVLDKLKIKKFGISVGRTKCGSQVPLIINEKGIKIGFLSYCAVEEGCMDDDLRLKVDVGQAVFNLKTFKKETALLRKKVHVIIVFMHMGEEYTHLPDKSKVDKLLKRMYNHVDIIIGAHPHVTQRHFYQNDVLVVPSLGNFLFPPRPTNHDKFNHLFRKNRTLYEESWYKATRLLKNPTQKGRLLKLEVNRFGLIKNKTQYLDTQILVNSRHCLYVDRDGDWKDVCSKNDKECLGTKDCNEIQCGGVYTIGKGHNRKKVKTESHTSTKQ